MKLGNISQSIVPVPKFFTDKTLSTIEIFKDNDFSHKKFNNKRKTSYFRSGDLFTSNKDINFVIILEHSQMIKIIVKKKNIFQYMIKHFMKIMLKKKKHIFLI